MNKMGFSSDIMTIDIFEPIALLENIYDLELKANRGQVITNVSSNNYAHLLMCRW